MSESDEIAELEAMVRAMASRLARMKARSAGELPVPVGEVLAPTDEDFIELRRSRRRRGHHG